MFTKSDLHKIFNKYYSALILYANRFLPSRDECEDLVQDIFVDLLEKDIAFPDEISLRVYLYKSTRNKCYNHIKHLRVKDRYASSFIKSAEDENLFLQHILEEEITRQLHQAIDTLSDRKKEIIQLSLRGLKNDEIAGTLGIRTQTVKTLKSSAYKLLRARFKELDNIIYFLLA